MGAVAYPVNFCYRNQTRLIRSPSNRQRECGMVVFREIGRDVWRFEQPPTPFGEQFVEVDVHISESSSLTEWKESMDVSQCVKQECH